METNKPGPAKVFDVGRPSPVHTSKPIIVGHRPAMADPMVRRPAPPMRPPTQAHDHDNKIIPVSPQSKASIIQAAKPLAGIELPVEVAAAAKPEPVFAVHETHQPPTTQQVLEPPAETETHSRWLWAVAFVVLVLLSLYIFIDAGLLNIGFKLPFHIFGS